MTYDVNVMTTHMTTRMTELAGGALECLSATGQVVLSFPLGTPVGAVAAQGTGARATFSGLPIAGTVALTGVAVASARLRTSAGVAYKTAIPVGIAGSGASVILSTLSAASGDTVSLISATIEDTQA